MRANRLLVSLLAGAFLGVAPASADEVTSAVDPCAVDMRRFCPDVKPGSGRVVGCLRANEASVSDACRARLDANALRARAFIEEFGRSCRRDVDRLCPGVDPGGGRVIGCLHQHQPELSATCQGEMTRIADARARVEAFKGACQDDVEALCKDVPPLAGPLLECLQANEARLSSDCNAADIRRAAEAASVVDLLEEMGSKDRILEALEILQGVDAVAFARSQILIQVDGFDHLYGKASVGKLTFNPQFVFGHRNEFSVQAKVPLGAMFPNEPSAPAAFGVGTLVTSVGWNFFAAGQVRQYLALGVQWETAPSPALGQTWALIPSYAVALGLARWVSLTTQVFWIRSLGFEPWLSGAQPAVARTHPRVQPPRPDLPGPRHQARLGLRHGYLRPRDEGCGWHLRGPAEVGLRIGLVPGVADQRRRARDLQVRARAGTRLLLRLVRVEAGPEPRPGPPGNRGL